jgi:hypothetical protein
MKPSTNMPLQSLSPKATGQLISGGTPETLLQGFILKVWQKLLGRVDIGIDDDFIEAGGSVRLKRRMVLAVEKATRQKI